MSIYVEWDEPGAGGICVDGKRVVNFNVETDWSDPWNPAIDPAGLALMDQLPRMAQEVEMAYATAKRYHEELIESRTDD